MAVSPIATAPAANNPMATAPIAINPMAHPTQGDQPDRDPTDAEQPDGHATDGHQPRGNIPQGDDPAGPAQPIAAIGLSPPIDTCTTGRSPQTCSERYSMALRLMAIAPPPTAFAIPTGQTTLRLLLSAVSAVTP